MLCPRCKSSKIYVVDSRPHDGNIRRRRVCPDCNSRFNTVEITEDEYNILLSKEETLNALRWRGIDG